MKKLTYLLLSAMAIISCNKQGPEYPKIKQQAVTHNFTGAYTLFDSSYTITRTASGTSTSTTHYSYSKSVSVFMDSTARYITVNADTFKWNETYKDFAGYYSYFLSPIDNNMVVLTADSIKLLTNRQEVGHALSTGLCIGYRKP